ncbi:Hypothetical_protein [Hexamita inflata]|uniref:Hypothetical_protein n=1 Tax=Hexamita inflata TaxID=28002 RepID=A0AA86NPX6_9EUKA|nr:Hypothetical protein HINF_LOCUS10688 [Hexamita inflata]
MSEELDKCWNSFKIYVMAKNSAAVGSTQMEAQLIDAIRNREESAKDQMFQYLQFADTEKSHYQLKKIQQILYSNSAPAPSIQAPAVDDRPISKSSEQQSSKPSEKMISSQVSHLHESVPQTEESYRPMVSSQISKPESQFQQYQQQQYQQPQQDTRQQVQFGEPQILFNQQENVKQPEIRRNPSQPNLNSEDRIVDALIRIARELKSGFEGLMSELEMINAKLSK